MNSEYFRYENILHALCAKLVQEKLHRSIEIARHRLLSDESNE